MESNTLIALAGIIVAGISAQWIAWRLRIPSILLLLAAGLIAGPVTGLINPDELFGDLLFPVVSLAVGLILFEGGLSLNLSELKEIGKPLRNLIFIGSAVTWTATAIAARYILGLPWQISLLLGAVLIVTGPTVILPLIRQVRLKGRLGSILKWEGILIDPLGASLALLVFQSIVIQEAGAATREILLAVLLTLFAGGLTGIGAGLLLTTMLRRYWIPDFLQSSVTMMFVLATFAIANTVQHESGLLAVTVMGVYLANQKRADVKHIIEFKENLRVLLVSGLFIVLSAQLHFDDFRNLPVTSILFVAVLILVIRPLTVVIATIGTGLKPNEKAYLAWMAPRGIVAASVASIFALRLEELGYEEAHTLAPLTFLVVAATVTVYGLTARPIARRLDVKQARPNGILFVSGRPWTLKLAAELQAENIPVLIADTNWSNISTARMQGIPTYFGNVLSDHAIEAMNLDGIGKLLALTPNDEVNSLACLHFLEDFGRADIYQLAPEAQSDRRVLAENLRGRLLFKEDASFNEIARLFNKGAVIKKTRITDEFTYEDFQTLYGQSAIPILTLDESKNARIFTLVDPPAPKPGEQLFSLVIPETETI